MRDAPHTLGALLDDVTAVLAHAGIADPRRTALRLRNDLGGRQADFGIAGKCRDLQLAGAFQAEHVVERLRNRRAKSASEGSVLLTHCWI